MIQVRFAGCTDRGQVRERNEDSYLAQPPVFIVADGMGGHSGGDQASQAAVAAFSKLTGREFVEAEEVLAAVSQAGVAVAGLYGGTRPPGSTLAGVAMTRAAGRPCWLVFNVGDSRVYLLRDGTLSQISEDHSGVGGVITRALGGGIARPAVADQWLLPVQAGDQMLVCSDGLYNEVTDLLMTATLLRSLEPERKAAELVAAATRAGGRDNVTAVVVVVDGVDAPPLRETTVPDDETQPEEETW